MNDAITVGCVCKSVREISHQSDEIKTDITSSSVYKDRYHICLLRVRTVMDIVQFKQSVHEMHVFIIEVRKLSKASRRVCMA
jgi:hypothetical protein